MRVRLTALLAPMLFLVPPLSAHALEGAEGSEAQEEVVSHPVSEAEIAALRQRVADLEDEVRRLEPDRAPDDVAGWGDTRWGMTAEEVKAKVPQAHEEGGTLRVDRRIADRPAAVELHLGAKGLERVTLRFFPTGSPAATVEDFGELRRLLGEKYGAADEENVSWNAEKSEAPPQKAVAEGRLELAATWYRGPTTIELALNGKGGRPVLEVRYLHQTTPPPQEEPQKDLLEGL